MQKRKDRRLSAMTFAGHQVEKRVAVPARAGHPVSNGAERAKRLTVVAEAAFHDAHDDRPPLVDTRQFTANWRKPWVTSAGNFRFTIRQLAPESARRPFPQVDVIGQFRCPLSGLFTQVSPCSCLQSPSYAPKQMHAIGRP